MSSAASADSSTPARSHPVPSPRISNVVATFTCGKQLDLLRFAQQYSFEFQPSRFAACAIRIKNSFSRSTALVRIAWVARWSATDKTNTIIPDSSFVRDAA